MVVEATSAICILYPVSKNPILLLLNVDVMKESLDDFAYCAERIVTLYIKHMSCLFCNQGHRT